MNAIDTNILVYAVDVFEPAKSRIAVELLERLLTDKNGIAVPWQVATEFLACLRRWENKGRINREQTIAHLSKFLGPLPIVHPTDAVLSASLELSGRYSLSHWDSMLLAACQEAGIETLLQRRFE